MKNLFNALFISVILATLFCGCSNKIDENITNNITVSVIETTETTATSNTEPTTELTTETTTQHTTVTTTKEQTAVSTTEKVITTQKSTTTVATTKKETTTQKPTTTTTITTKKVATTQKPNTTQRETTVKIIYCDEGSTHHRLDDGQIGWYNTYDEAMVAKEQYCKEHPNVKYILIEQCACRLFTVTPIPTPTPSPYYCFEGGIHHGRYVGPIGWYNSYNEAQEAVRLYIIEHPEYLHYTIEGCDCDLWTASFN